MTQLPRFFLTAAVAGVCVFASPVFVVLPPSAAYGEEVEESADTADTADTAESTEPKAAPETVAPDANSALRQEVKDFWHYAKIARYEAATDSLSKVIARESEALAVLGAFEQVSRARRDDLDTWLFRWQGTKELREPVTKLLTMLEAGRLERRLIPAQINENIERLNQGERPFDIASSRLKDSGELAVSIMVDWLKNPERKAHHAGVRRALVRMGRAAVNPLVAATAVKDADTLVQVIAVLGDLGYDAAVPYLLELVQSDRSTAVKQAAKQALGKLGVTDPAAVNAADAFYDLAENLYYGRASLVYDAQFPNAFVWNWDEQTGLLKKEVPAAIFNDVMSMRCSEQSLRLSPDKGEAVSLWLAANYKREVDLPQGATDASRAENTPNAHYYGVASGAQFLEAALNRALRDNNAAVALKAIESLQQIVGQSNLFTAEQRPLIDALRYADRRVRFEAAFTLAAALPTSAFAGQERVVPLLSEAIAQTGKPGVVVVLPTQDAANLLVDELKGLGYTAVGATGAQAAISAALAMPAVDAIVISEDVDASELNRLLTDLLATPRLERVSRVIITKTTASVYAQQAANDVLLTATQATDGAGLKASIEEARARAGALPLDEALATQYALRSAGLMKNLLINGNTVLEVTGAQTTLLAALSDPRADVVKAAADVLALFGNKETQQGLLVQAETAEAADDARVALYKSVATSAKFAGNLLEPSQIEPLQKTAETASSFEVRSAAAEALGALSLPAERIKTLITDRPVAAE